MGQLVNFCAGTNMDILPANRVEAILINAPTCGESPRSLQYNLHMIKAIKAKWVMLDSGGFQLHQAEKYAKKITCDRSKSLICTDTEVNLTPEHVMEVASIIKPDIVVGLDFPIRNIPDAQEQEMEFMQKAGYNILWAIESANLREQLCPDVQFFLPIQCYNLEQLEKFLGLLGQIKYDGVSMPIRNLNTKQIALFLTRFFQQGIRQVHILGTSKFFVIALCAYMARHLFDQVSFDATTWKENAE